MKKMSKKSSGLFWGTIGSRKIRLVPGRPGKVTGGNSQKLGKNLMQSMGVSRKTKWTGYQAQHIIPVKVRNHPILKKVGFDLDSVSNGIFLRVPSNSVSSLARHQGNHAPYNDFVEKKLNQLNINDSTNNLQKELKYLQSTLRKMLQSGVTIYKKDGASVESLERAYNRYNERRN